MNWEILCLMIAAIMMSPKVSSVQAQAPDQASGLSSQDIGRIRQVTDVAIRPGGSEVAYILSVPRDPFEDEDGPSRAELWIAGPDSEPRPYLTGDIQASAPRWTPDGKSVSFLAKRGKDKAVSLYAIPANGGEARKLLGQSTDILGYSLSPNGKQVAFLAKPPTSKEVEDARKLGFTQEIYEESLKPTQAWIATWGDDPAVEPKTRLLELPGSASMLEWSPKGDRIALALAPTPTVDDNYMSRRVHVIDAETGSVTAKIENPGKLGPIAWSPDGERLAIISAEDIHDPSEGRLMVVSAKGGELKDLLPGFEGHVTSVVWKSPERILYLADVGASSLLGEVGSQGGSPPTILVQPSKRVLSHLDLAGSALAMIGQTPEHPAEAFSFSPEHSEPKRLSDSNPWLAARSLAKQEVVTWKARDGVELEGILIRPLHQERDQPAPLIMYVHGGPESHISNGWVTNYSNPGQAAAERGFAVFCPNYRGSTGRGVAFSKMGQGDPAGKEFDDLIDGIDFLVAQGWVDKAKVGITGGSYGGYATAWCVTRYSERFAAGVMMVGISNKISKFGTTDIPNEEYFVHALKRPWENWQGMLERSPIFHADKCKTPTLIAHGKDDPRVYPGQSMEFYRYLKVHGQAPVRLVWYPGEGHGNRRAASRYDFSLRMLRWMEHYLQGPGGAPPAIDLTYPPFVPKKNADADAKTSQSADSAGDSSR